MGTPTTNQEYAVMEMWSTMLSQYVSAMGTVLVVYDYLLTIQDEVCLILLRLRAVSVCTPFVETPCVARRPEFPQMLVLLESIPHYIFFTILHLLWVVRFCWEVGTLKYYD